MPRRLFPEILKFWRKRRGWSQLTLSAESRVTPRHVSFLESGRAAPSEAMVLRLCTALSVPLRAQNEALRAAGFSPRHPEPGFDSLDPKLTEIIDAMLAQHEPFPMSVVAIDGTLLRTNRAAPKIFGAFCLEPLTTPPKDMVSLLFDERAMRPFVVDWPTLARTLVARMHREFLDTGDERLAKAIERARAYPGVPADWLEPDFATEPEPVFTTTLERNSLRVRFAVATTRFSSPQWVTVEELRVEGAYPLDERTRRTCRQLVRA